MFCFSRKFWVAGLSAVLAVSAFGGFFGASPEKDRALADLKQISADKWSIVGRNIVAEGNVQIPYGQFHVRPDRAVVNIESRDIAAVGNTRLFNRLEEKTTITPQRLAELQRHPETVITIDDVTFNPLGEAALNVTIVYMGDSLTAQKLSGNLITGYFKIHIC